MPWNVYPTFMRVRLNGESREVADGVTVAQLIAELGLGERRVAVEINRSILRRDLYAEHCVRDGDELEIVHFIGGG